MIDGERRLAQIERRAAPSRWPPRLAMALGAACLIAAAWANGVLSDSRAAATVTFAAVRDAEASGASVALGPRRDHRVAVTEVATWERRRLGLLLAGVILLAGGFVASGLRLLHDKIRWVVPADDEALNSPGSSTDRPLGRSSSDPD